MPEKKGTDRRELIDTGRDKRYVARHDKGRLTESDDVGRSLSRDEMVNKLIVVREPSVTTVRGARRCLAHRLHPSSRASEGSAHSSRRYSFASRRSG